MRATWVALCLLLLALAGSPVGAESSESSWRDDFGSMEEVSESSGVVFTGGAIELDPTGTIRKGRVLPLGINDTFDSVNAAPDAVLVEGGTYKMWYHGCRVMSCRIAYATSRDGLSWAKQGIVIEPTLPKEGDMVLYSDVLRVANTYWIFYSGYDGTNYRIFGAKSLDGVSWTKLGVVLEPGPAGEPDDLYVWRPTVVFAGDRFRMWYSGVSWATQFHHEIFAAESPDGATWTKLGRVLGLGDPGSPDDDWAAMASVRVVDGAYEMVYAGRSRSGPNSTSYERLLRAHSFDGLAWKKDGVLLDVLPPDETPRLTHPAIVLVAHPAGTRSLFVYYSSRPPLWEGYLAVLPLDEEPQGWVRSEAVRLPPGRGWVELNVSGVEPPGSSLRVTLRDAASGDPVLGFTDLRIGEVDLGGIDPSAHPAVILEAVMTGSEEAVPALEAWAVLWSPPASFPLSAVAGGTALAAIVGIGIVVALRASRRPRRGNN